MGTLVRQEKIVRILHPFGDPFEGDGAADIVIGEKEREVLIRYSGVDGHGWNLMIV